MLTLIYIYNRMFKLIMEYIFAYFLKKILITKRL